MLCFQKQPSEKILLHLQEKGCVGVSFKGTLMQIWKSSPSYENNILKISF